MKTNFQMIKELNDFTPANRGILTGEEVKHIKATLHLDEMDELALRNMRDFAVMFYSKRIDKFEDEQNYEEMFKLMDKMSGVTGVIDNRLWSIGAEM